MTVDQTTLAHAIEVYNTEAKRLAEIVRAYPRLCDRIFAPDIDEDGPLSLSISSQGLVLGYVVDDYENRRPEEITIPLPVALATPRELAAMEGERQAREAQREQERLALVRSQAEAKERAEFERLKAKFGGHLSG